MEKKQLILRIPYTLWEDLNRMAEDEFRSLNGQIEYILTQAVRNSKTRTDVIAEEMLHTLAETLAKDGKPLSHGNIRS